jgi:hypothetical protein
MRSTRVFLRNGTSVRAGAEPLAHVFGAALTMDFALDTVGCARCAGPTGPSGGHPPPLRGGGRHGSGVVVVRACLRPSPRSCRERVNGSSHPIDRGRSDLCRSIVMLDSAHRKVPVPALARWLLGWGIAATPVANVVVLGMGVPRSVPRWGWSAVALMGSYNCSVMIIRGAQSVNLVRIRSCYSSSSSSSPTGSLDADISSSCEGRSFNGPSSCLRGAWYSPPRR